MELLIRSQDKEALVKMLDGIYYYYDEETKEHTIHNGYNNLRIYKTKERALEVLDEIQKLLSLKCTISGDYETQDLQIKALNLQIQRLIYNMPKE